MTRAPVLALVFTLLTGPWVPALAQQAECKNEAFEVNGNLIRVVEGRMAQSGEEFFRSIGWLESLQAMEACGGIVAKAESRFKRRESFVRTIGELPQPYKQHFENMIAESEKDKAQGQQIRANILQKDIDSLRAVGLSITEACSVVYGQWSWTAIHHAVAFKNAIPEIAKCQSNPLVIHRPPAPR